VNAKESILSGAIEACILGAASDADWQELEQMCAQFPEVKAEKERLEIDMERQHLSMSIMPPPALKQSIFASMTFEKPHEEAAVFELPKQHEEPPADARPKVVPMMPTPKPVRWLQRALAISAVLLMGSILLNFYYYSKSVTTQKQYNALVVQQSSLITKNEALESSFNMMKDPGMKQVVMNATPDIPAGMATVYWNDKSKDVYLLVNNLPKPATDKQYQLWAIVDGKPVDAGMVTTESDSVLIKMKNIPNAQAFAITLENKGGNPTPTMPIYVVGAVEKA
jgi:hypothetical protein